MESVRIVGLTVPNVTCKDLSDVNKNLEAHERIIRETPGYDVYLLPELSSTGYGGDSFANIEELAETVDGNSPGCCVGHFSRVSASLRVYIAFGFIRRSGEHFYICHGVVDREGALVCCYDKMHLCSFGVCAEKVRFTAGKHVKSFMVDGAFRFGMLICYDMRFPKLFTSLMHRHQGEIDGFLHPVAFAKDVAYQIWEHFVVTRAVENQAYVFSVNYSGEEFGGSMAVPPAITEETKMTRLGDQEGVIDLVVCKHAIKSARDVFPILTDQHSDYRAD